MTNSSGLANFSLLGNSYGLSKYQLPITNTYPIQLESLKMPAIGEGFKMNGLASLGNNSTKPELYNNFMFKDGSMTNLGKINAGLGAVNAITGLANAFLGYKNLKLAEEQFDFQKAAANRNIANQAKIINNTIDNAAQVGAGLSGVGTYDANQHKVVYSDADKAAVAERMQDAKEKHVDGSKIG